MDGPLYLVATPAIPCPSPCWLPLLLKALAIPAWRLPRLRQNMLDHVGSRLLLTPAALHLLLLLLHLLKLLLLQSLLLQLLLLHLLEGLLLVLLRERARRIDSLLILLWQSGLLERARLAVYHPRDSRQSHRSVGRNIAGLARLELRVLSIAGLTITGLARLRIPGLAIAGLAGLELRVLRIAGLTIAGLAGLELRVLRIAGLTITRLARLRIAGLTITGLAGLELRVLRIPGLAGLDGVLRITGLAVTGLARLRVTGLTINGLRALLLRILLIVGRAGDRRRGRAVSVLIEILLGVRIELVGDARGAHRRPLDRWDGVRRPRSLAVPRSRTRLRVPTVLPGVESMPDAEPIPDPIPFRSRPSRSTRIRPPAGPIRRWGWLEPSSPANPSAHHPWHG